MDDELKTRTNLIRELFALGGKHTFDLATNKYYNHITDEFVKSWEAVPGNKDKYEERNGRYNPDTLRLGKKAEFCQYHIAKHLGCSEPDVQVFGNKKDKSWDPDLHLSPWTIGVKSCDNHTLSVIQRYRGSPDKSWTINNHDRFNASSGHDAALLDGKDPLHVLSLVYMPSWEADSFIVCRILPQFMLERFLSDPVVPKLKGIKVNIYLKDLPSPDAIFEELRTNDTTSI